MRYKFISLIIMFYSLYCITYPSGKIVLKMDPQNSPPKLIRESDGSYSGMAVELMKLIEKNSIYKFEIGKEFVPTSRIESNLINGITDFHFGFGMTGKRVKYFKFSEETLYELQHVVISRSDEKEIIRTIDDLKKLQKKEGVVIIAIRGTNSADYLKKNGLKVDDSVLEISAGLQKLEMKRGRFFVYNNVAVKYQLEDMKNATHFKIHPVIMEKFYHYMIFSKMVDDKTIKEIDRTIAKLKKDGSWDKVIKKYLQ